MSTCLGCKNLKIVNYKFDNKQFMQSEDKFNSYMKTSYKYFCDPNNSIVPMINVIDKIPEDVMIIRNEKVVPEECPRFNK